MGLAPRTVQDIPDGLRREPITVLHPAWITPEPTNKCWRRNLGWGIRSAFLSKYSASVQIFSASHLVSARGLGRWRFLVILSDRLAISAIGRRQGIRTKTGNATSVGHAYLALEFARAA